MILHALPVVMQKAIGNNKFREQGTKHLRIRLRGIEAADAAAVDKVKLRGKNVREVLGSHRLFRRQSVSQGFYVFQPVYGFFVGPEAVLMRFVKAQPRQAAANLIIKRRVRMKRQQRVRRIQQLLLPIFGRMAAGYKGFIAEIPQYGSVVGKTIMLPIFVAVYIHLAGARALFLIIRGFYVNQFAVGI